MGYDISVVASGNATITSISQLTGILILIVFVAGCAAIQETHGISPTDLSNLRTGMEQSEVENIVGDPIAKIEKTDRGYSAAYRFNRGYLPYENYKASRAALYEFTNIMSLGTASLNRYDSQRALLRVEYDEKGNLIYAEEEMAHECSNSFFAGTECKATQKFWLYPSTLPLPVTKLYHRAEQGDVEAQNELDLYKDIDMCCLNADLGLADAQKHIGVLYYLGTERIERNLYRAYIWYSLAAKGGDGEAAAKLNQLVSEMSSEKLEHAQVYLEAWRPGQCKRDLFGAISQ